MIFYDKIIINKVENHFNFILAWGGEPNQKYGAAFMKFKFLKSKIKKNIIFCDWKVDMEIVKKILIKKYSLANIISIVGFSQGGLRAWKEVCNDSYKIVVLIDPVSMEEDVVRARNSTKNTLMICNKKGFIYRGVNYYSKRIYSIIEILGNKVIDIDVDHLDLPEYFFSKHGYLL